MIDADVSVEALADAVKHTHGCDAHFVERVEVTEMFDGAIAWTGSVTVFDVNHAVARRAYAWSYATEGERRRFVAVLGLGPVTSPQTAVQAYLFAEAKKRGVA